MNKLTPDLIDLPVLPHVDGVVAFLSQCVCCMHIFHFPCKYSKF